MVFAEWVSFGGWIMPRWTTPSLDVVGMLAPLLLSEVINPHPIAISLATLVNGGHRVLV